MRNAFASVNPLALLALLTAAILTGIGRLEPESFMLLVTGLAIPARSDGYQNVGTRPLKVEGVPGGEPVAVDPEPDPPAKATRSRRERGEGELRTILLFAAGGLLCLIVWHFLLVPAFR